MLHSCNRHQRKRLGAKRIPKAAGGFDYEELLKRDKVNLDIFWLGDKSLEESDDLRTPTCWPRSRRRPANRFGTIPRNRRRIWDRTILNLERGVAMAKRVQLVSQHLKNISHEALRGGGCYSRLCSWSSRDLRAVSKERTLLRRTCLGTVLIEKSFGRIKKKKKKKKDNVS